MNYLMLDWATLEEKVTPPSRAEMYFEEIHLQHAIKVHRNNLEAAVKARDHLSEKIPEMYADLHKLLDIQERRGFARVEKLHGIFVWLRWDVFAMVVLIATALGFLAALTR